MPTILRIEPFRFFFYSNELGEPAHIHVQSDNKTAKFWLEPVSLSKSVRFSSKELRELEKLVTSNKAVFMEAWNEYFNTK